MEPVIKTRGQPGLSINFSYIRGRVELINFEQKKISNSRRDASAMWTFCGSKNAKKESTRKFSRRRGRWERKKSVDCGGIF